MTRLQIRVPFLLMLALPATSFAADVGKGQTAFQSTCVRCHTAGPTGLKTPPGDLAAVLKSGTIRKHRFMLSDTDIEDLTAYVESTKAPK
jgi:mono/diheme cytochrome c family protein